MELYESTFKLIFTSRVIDGKAFMLLDKHIGPDKDNPNSSYIDGPRFAEEMYWLKSQGYEITAKINSPGGRVDHGWSIIDSIVETGATTHLIGLGASMAGVAFLFGKKRIADEHATLMLHGPSGGGSKKYLEILKSQFSSLIASFSKFPKEKAEALIASGDHFFDISDMEDYGFIDEVRPTGKKFIKPKTASASVLYEAYASVIQETNNVNEMEIFNKLFGGKSDSENAIAAIQMKAENDKLVAEKTAWASEKLALEAKLKAIEDASKFLDIKAKSKELIEGAEKAGKLSFKDEAAKAKAIEDASANFDFTKSLIEAMPSKKNVSASSFVSNDKPEQNTYEWLAKNDPKKLSAIAESDPDLFNKLSDEYIAKQSEQK